MQNMTSLQNLELLLSHSLKKYGPDETVQSLYTILLGEIYDFNPVPNDFYSVLTQMLARQSKRLSKNYVN